MKCELRETPWENSASLAVSKLEVGLFTYAREMTAAIYTDDIRHPCAYHILLKIHPFFPKNDSERGDSLWNCVSTISSSPYWCFYYKIR